MNTSQVSRPGGSWLLCRVGDRLIAVPLAHVVETMRPLPLRSFPGLPHFVPGVCLIRDAVVPVIDLAALLDGSDRTRPEVGAPAVPGAGADPARLVTVERQGRTVALEVDAVIGVRDLDRANLHEVPPVLDTLDSGALAAVGTLDSGLLLVLGESLLVPESVWAVLAESEELLEDAAEQDAADERPVEAAW